MPIKRILILANSVKGGQHCVAGREVFEHKGKITYGGWIRPVSHDDAEGALSSSQCSLKGGPLVEVGDVVEVPLEGPEGYAPQPENWFIDESAAWRRVDLDAELSGVPLDRPSSLWADWTPKNDRVQPSMLPKLSTKGSLLLIQPQKLSVRMGWDSFQGGPAKHRRRANFEFNGQRYDLALTDPAIERKYCNPYPSRSAGMPLVELENPDACRLCVSLTRPYEFTGCHHKIVATIIEL